MFENVTVDTILRDYYFALSSDKLSEDKINIDEDLVVEDSFKKYLDSFVSFLNESYYRGYVISESIVKKLMDIIEYEGFEYQIIQGYINILLENMNDYKVDESNRPPYGQVNLTADESMQFVNKYLEALKTGSLRNFAIPHIQRIPGATENGFTLRLLIEVNNPINLIANNISIEEPRKYVNIMSALYDYNINTYIKLGGLKSVYGLVPLLEKTDKMSFDLLTETIKSFESLQYLVDTHRQLVPIGTNAIRRVKWLSELIVTHSVMKFIKINNKIPVIYNITGYGELLSIADRYVDCSPDLMPYIWYINYINTHNSEDKYVFYRNLILNMEFEDFSNNFIALYKAIEDKLELDKLAEIINEYIDGIFMSTDNPAIFSRLKQFKGYLATFHEPVFNTFIEAIDTFLKSSN